MLITYKWQKVRAFIISFLFVPHMALLLVHNLWHFYIRPRRSEYESLNALLVSLQFILVLYFGAQELYQMYFDGLKAYILSILINVTQVFPLLSITICGLFAVSVDEVEEETNMFITVIETLSILCLWLQVFLYLSIWDGTNFLTRMLKEVLTDMREFLIMFLIA